MKIFSYPLTVILTILFSSSYSLSVWATPIFDVTVTSTLTVTSIDLGGGDRDDLLLEGQAEVFDIEDFTEGDASADANATVVPDTTTELGEGDSIQQSVAINGNAGPNGLAVAFALTDGELFFENFSDVATFTIGLTLDYVISATASVDDALGEFALALATVSLESLAQNAFLVDVSGQIDTVLNPLDSPFTASDSLAFDIVLTAGDSETLFLAADAEGEALADAVAVTTPASMALLMFGLAIGAFGKRRSS